MLVQRMESCYKYSFYLQSSEEYEVIESHLFMTPSNSVYLPLCTHMQNYLGLEDVVPFACDVALFNKNINKSCRGCEDPACL